MRRLVVLVAVAGLVAAFAAPGAAASSRPAQYLALGDSIAFGYSPKISPYDTDAFIGYPEYAAASLHQKVANAACPGETSSHFISLTGADHGCGDFRFIAQAPLHVPYSGSQLAYVDAFLKSHPMTQVVTIDIGANDVGSLRDTCLATANPIGCLQAGLPGMLATLSANLDTIYRHIRVVDGYHRTLVGVTLYSYDYSDQLVTGAIAMVNNVFTERTLAWGGIVADGFSAFAAASAPSGGDACAAGLLIPIASGCDAHPSVIGQKLLAQTVVAVIPRD